MFLTAGSASPHMVDPMNNMMTRDRFDRALKILSALHPPLEKMTRTVRMFLMIADHHPRGITQSELVGTIDPDRQNVSRWVKLLGEVPYRRINAPGKTPNLGLVRAVPSELDQRTLVLTLTTLGVRVKARIDRVE